MIAQPMRMPAAPATTMQLSSRMPCASDLLEQWWAVADADREPERRAEDHAVEMSTKSAPTPSSDPTGEREDRDADVVREDLARERGLLVDRDAPVLAARARLADVLELARHDAAGRTGIAPRPVAAEQRGTEEAQRRERDEADALAHPSPVAVRDELAQRAAASTRVVHRAARPRARVARAARATGRRETAGARSRGPRRWRGTSCRGGAHHRHRDATAGSRAGRRARSSSVHTGARSLTNSSSVPTCTSTTGSWSRRPRASTLDVVLAGLGSRFVARLLDTLDPARDHSRTADVRRLRRRRRRVGRLRDRDRRRCSPSS